jgi:nucleotide-binding universal stress UspA family protein
MKVRSILVGTDFSESSFLGVDVAAMWATRFEASLVLVHAFDASPPPVPGLAEGSESLVDAGAYEAATWCDLTALQRERLAQVRDVRLGVLRHGSAALAICDTAKEQQVDLVVVGTEGRTGMSRLVLGSVAEQVVRHAPCPVLCVRGDALATRFPAHVLVCTDFSPSAEAAVDLAADVAQTFRSMVTVAHVYDPSRWRATGDDGAAFERDLGDAVARIHSERFSHGVQTAVIRDHSVAEALVGHARKCGADLIVVSTHGRTGLSRLIIGSVAERVTRHAPCSVLIARARDLAP